ncbi:hypothetical protein [Legionella massiliensis]|uniref:hypothetical protein n=1 Tax=Legionella massiliensis TaxID=1034943 RepID=UPI000A5E2133|nr:hypothetical protein [Legionella massiliensis]
MTSIILFIVETKVLIAWLGGIWTIKEKSFLLNQIADAEAHCWTEWFIQDNRGN